MTLPRRMGVGHWAIGAVSAVLIAIIALAYFVS